MARMTAWDKFRVLSEGRLLDAAERRAFNVASRVRRGELLDDVMRDIRDIVEKDLRTAGFTGRVTEAARVDYLRRVRSKAAEIAVDAGRPLHWVYGKQVAIRAELNRLAEELGVR